VLILDADFGLGNLDVLLGVAPKYNISHVIRGDKTIEEVLEEGPGKIKILPAASGIQELTQLTHDQKMQFFTHLDRLVDDMDILLIDTAAGISSNVMDFNVMAHEIIGRGFARADLHHRCLRPHEGACRLSYAEKSCKLLVNQVASPREAQDVFRQLDLVTDRFSGHPHRLFRLRAARTTI